MTTLSRGQRYCGKARNSKIGQKAGVWSIASYKNPFHSNYSCNRSEQWLSNRGTCTPYLLGYAKVLQEVSSVASPKFWGSKYFDFTRATVFCLEHRFSKHKTTRYARNSGGMAPCPPLAKPTTRFVKHKDIRSLVAAGHNACDER